APEISPPGQRAARTGITFATRARKTAASLSWAAAPTRAAAIPTSTSRSRLRANMSTRTACPTRARAVLSELGCVFVLLDHPRLVLRLVDPFGHMRMRQHRLHVDAGEVRHGDAISDQSGDHRRIHHVRRAPVAEQEIASSAEAGASLCPKLQDPIE